MGQRLSSCGEAELSRRESLSPLHVAALNGRDKVVCMILDGLENPNVLTRHRQTPLMLASMHGNLSCVQALIQAQAQILMFDSVSGGTCLHYASYYGHSDCLQAILSAARSSHVSHSWGFQRLVNIRDRHGFTPLHLAARKRRPDCVRVLLDHGALVSASTTGNGYPGSTPLHMAARSGSIDCVRGLLARGANRLQLDLSGRTPYTVAMRHKNRACAALLDPLASEPLVWPWAMKLLNELSSDTKALLERALVEANNEREKEILKNSTLFFDSELSSSSSSKSSICDEEDNNASELCSICFERSCSIEVKPCDHRICERCVLCLCCQKKKPKPITNPLCPFCRSTITQLNIINDQTLNPKGSAISHKSLSRIGSFTSTFKSNSGKVDAESSD